jgi:hypothetical protein
MSTLEVNSLQHLDASVNNIDLDSSGNATVNGDLISVGNLTSKGIADTAPSTSLAVTAAGATVTGVLSATQGRVPFIVDNDSLFDLDVGQNFSCTPTANIALEFVNISNGQSGYILLANATPYTISISASTVKASDKATFLSTVSTAGTYLISYISDGTNVYLTNSLVLT